MFFWNLLGILFGFGEEEEGDGRAEIDPNG
jgi:hypothetical protein